MLNHPMRKKDNTMNSNLHSKHRFLASILACFIVLGCPPATSLMLGTASGAIATQEQPNIVWITSEDNGISWVGCYGGTNAKTPTIDMLAEEGFRYTHCFDNAAVCAPTRSCWITGMYGISNGTQPMRSRNMIPHDQIKYYPDLLKQAGYHTSNPLKTDYNIGGRDDKDCWDDKGGEESYGWRKRKPGQPFFAVVNIVDSHESRAHGNVNDLQKDPAKMQLFSYHPDLPIIRQNYAKYAAAVENMDRKVADTLEALKKDGLYDDTIIIYNSDHGGVMARSKRFLYASGVHCPLVIRIPRKLKHLYPAEKPGMSVDRIVSFVDMPKTWLSLAGAQIPRTFQGTIFLGKGTEPAPTYHLSFRERADERLDHVRMIRDERFAYHKNYMPYAPAGQHLAYLDAADLALVRDKSNLDTLVKSMSDRDGGMRWWAVVGLHLLESDAAPAVGMLEQALRDESHEVRMMAAWTLVKLGQAEQALACLDELLFQGTSNPTMLHNVLDWMGKPALPLVKKYIETGGTRQGRYGIGILGRIAESNGW